MSLNSYVTLEELRAEIGTEKTRDDRVLIQACLDASHDLEVLAYGRYFYPRYATRKYDHQHQQRLEVDRDLNLIESIVTDNGATTVTASEYQLRSGLDPNDPIGNVIIMDPFTSVEYFNIGTSQLLATAVTGYWGFCDLSEQLVYAGTQAAVVASDARQTTFTMTLPSGQGWEETEDDRFRNPMIHTLSLLAAAPGGSNPTWEFAFVRKVEGNRITVNTGHNGTDRSWGAFESGTATIYAFYPIEPIRRAARRLAKWYYNQRDSSRPDLDRPIVAPNGAVLLPSGFPKDVTTIAESYAALDWDMM